MYTQIHSKQVRLARVWLSKRAKSNRTCEGVCAAMGQRSHVPLPDALEVGGSSPHTCSGAKCWERVQCKCSAQR